LTDFWLNYKALNFQGCRFFASIKIGVDIDKREEISLSKLKIFLFSLMLSFTGMFKVQLKGGNHGRTPRFYLVRSCFAIEHWRNGFNFWSLRSSVARVKASLGWGAVGSGDGPSLAKSGQERGWRMWLIISGFILCAIVGFDVSALFELARDGASYSGIG
jgi:hypothetical protein